MALRYSAEFLLHLRESPLCRRPDSLPPAEEWMGAPVEQGRTQNKTSGDRPRTGDNPLLDQTNRRPTLERHVSRNSANPEDIVFAPPRMAFASARGNKSLENDVGLKEPDSHGRFNHRGRNGDSDLDRLRNGRNNPLQRRGDGEQDTEGWSTVKPRKSFGHEGAERFHGKMGGNFRDERRPIRDRDNGDAPRDRTSRTFDSAGRDKDGDDVEGRSRNQPGRSKLDLWYRSDNTEAPTPEKRERERGDKMKSWRDRDSHPEPSDDRNNTRNQDRRWGRDRDQRVEREPEWLDEPNEGQREAHTQQDFQKWMEQMKKAKSNPSNAAAKPIAEATVDSSAEIAAALIEAERPVVQSAPAVELGPDKFFMAFGPPSAGGLDAVTPGEQQKEVSGKSKPSGKSSRFTSFFAQPQEENRGRTEPPTPLAGPLLSILGGGSTGASLGPGPSSGPGPGPGPNHNLNIQPHQAPAPEEERQAFQQLLAKLQKQSMSATPPAASPFSAPNQPQPGNLPKKNQVTSPEPFHQYGGGAAEGLGRPPSQHVQEILAPRPQPQARPEQLLQDLVGHHQRTSSQGSGRPEQGVHRNNSNTEFLMNLMRAAPEAQRPDQHMMRMPQQQQKPQQQGPTQLPQLNDREQDFGRDGRAGPQRQMRPQPPPGFPLDESFHGHEQDSHPRPPNQPTQILQRPPPPPGLDQMPPNWMQGGAQMPPPPPPPGPQQRGGPMMPPPGLAGPGRNMPLPHMFPPNFPPGAMPPPEVMGGMPPRNMPPPPPGFFNGPPHGFMPPGMAGFNGPPGPGPDAHVYAGGPFEGRGMPPPGNPGRGAAYGRL
ncbi:hypothetical protein HJFPF1_06182 [Paramyrothecium foliicola]|nr:hypothetical protein HJFPF1_06182 [Paramyrothecium foliicola]